jgi:hypothetical protein
MHLRYAELCDGRVLEESRVMCSRSGHVLCLKGEYRRVVSGNGYRFVIAQ